jgi:hypothetical protein
LAAVAGRKVLEKKFQIINNKKITMTEIQNSKPIYDLEESTFQFAKTVRLFVKEFINETNAS